MQIALSLSQKQDIQLIMPGGVINPSTSAINGSLAIRTLDVFNIDLALTSCAGINAEGAYELSLETAQLKQFAMQKSKYKMLIATENKFTVNAPYRVLKLEEYDSIVTDAADQTVVPLKSRGVRINNN